MAINDNAWEELRKQINDYLKEDTNITDIAINYQVKLASRDTKNILRLGVKIDKDII